jgi:hypothetical protein
VALDVKSMAEGFYSVAFRHVSRVLNGTAHTLARSCDHGLLAAPPRAPLVNQYTPSYALSC